MQNSSLPSEDLTKFYDLPPINSLNSSICPIFIGIAGGSASGKTTLCNAIISEIGLKSCLVISLDSFYKPLDESTDPKEYNFDHPDSLDFDLCYEVIKKLLNRETAEIPIYNFVTNAREKETVRVEPTDLLLLEGILALYDSRLVKLMNLKLFVDCDNDIRLYRRMQRDIKERGRDPMGILFQYNRFVKPAFDELIKPTMNYANLIIPGRSKNQVAINFIVQNLRMQLARLLEMKKGMYENAFYADILDSCWVNMKHHSDEEKTDDLRLFNSEGIIFLQDQAVKDECLKMFKLFSNPFHESVYVTLILRLNLVGINLMRSYMGNSAEKYCIVYYKEDLVRSPVHPTQQDTVGILVPFLYKDTLEDVKKKLDSILEKKKNNKKTFVVSIFADIPTVTNLSQLYVQKDVRLVNVLYSVHVPDLFSLFKENCETPDYDFINNEINLQLMLESSHNELLKEELKAQ